MLYSALLWKSVIQPVGLLVFIVLLLLFPCDSPADEEGVLYQQRLAPCPFPLMIPASINGTTYTFVLDTGSTTHIFDSILSRYLGQLRRTELGATAGGNVELKLYDPPPIKIGSWSLPALATSVFDFQNPREITGIDIRGAIGVGVMDQCALSLDFDHQTMKILGGRFTVPAGMQSLDLGRDQRGDRTIKLEIQNQSVEFTIDTGADGDILLPHEMFARLIAEGAIKVEDSGGGVSQTAGGLVQFRPAHFTKGRLLGIDLAGIRVEDGQGLCNIAMGFIVNFNVIMDFKNSRFYYRHRAAPPPLDQEKMLGVTLLYPHGRNHVYKIKDGGAARDAGFRLWDRIVRLGPLKETEINKNSIYELCLDHAGETLEVEIQRPGEEKPVHTRLKLPKALLLYPPRRSEPSN